MDEATLVLKPALPVVTIRPTVSAFRCFHTNSSGLRSGKYGGEKEQLQFAAKCFNEDFRLLGAMRGASIDDEKDCLLRANQKPLQELDEHAGVHAAFFLDHETHFPSRCDR